ncbi:hypothetical protein L873DRAFT_178917 [Choiromyces venosus 120613-1]|uniref:Uncharacterized protein n=1 Tax=Choiromyces venosus 120613-1 TaxID=1336337 RepID=A0A3N4JZY7_9PEZI|nr:hypothetical protein L873DRAFT_178917 [Choiromyces venosus 120613-1]
MRARCLTPILAFRGPVYSLPSSFIISSRDCTCLGKCFFIELPFDGLVIGYDRMCSPHRLELVWCTVMGGKSSAAGGNKGKKKKKKKGQFALFLTRVGSFSFGSEGEWESWSSD